MNLFVTALQSKSFASLRQVWLIVRAECLKEPQIENFRKITLGMDMSQVVSLVGMPRRMIRHGDDGVLTLEYRLADGGQRQVDMKYVVVSVCQVMEGATILLT